MKRFIPILFLSLYAYNIAGYLLVFTAMQSQIRKEIKLRIKESVPRSDLVTIAVHAGDEAALHWIEDREFRYRGSLFDVVRSRTSNDTTYYDCINDTQEELLFANLDTHIRVQMDIEGTPKKAADVFKGIVRDYLIEDQTFPVYLPAGAPLTDVSDMSFVSFTPDVPTPPPRVA